MKSPHYLIVKIIFTTQFLAKAFRFWLTDYQCGNCVHKPTNDTTIEDQKLLHQSFLYKSFNNY